ncbi:DUF4158 domain-containing protein [Streptomyces sp. NPDC008313]|uniref:DUF4158 domain-containing protein n=1 Tax=Streptomyces sp. NPDC008313 TaxID=3364826 RepID=UPI0036EE60F7
MRQDWEPEDLIEVWTLLEDDMKEVRNKSRANRLGFALLLKFLEVEARFPESAEEMPAAAVVARCRNDRIEPLAPGRVGRLVGKAVEDFEVRFCRSGVERISHATRSRLEDLVAGSQDETGEGADGRDGVSAGGRSHAAELKADPGRQAWKACWRSEQASASAAAEPPADLFAGVEGVSGEPGADEAAAAPDAAGRAVPCAADGSPTRWWTCSSSSC